jgi:ribosome modulation factor
MSNDDYSDAYDEGIDAAEDGKSISDCPYPDGSEAAEEWMDGFEAVGMF